MHAIAQMGFQKWMYFLNRCQGAPLPETPPGPRELCEPKTLQTPLHVRADLGHGRRALNSGVPVCLTNLSPCFLQHVGEGSLRQAGSLHLEVQVISSPFRGADIYAWGTRGWGNALGLGEPDSSGSPCQGLTASSHPQFSVSARAGPRLPTAL